MRTCPQISVIIPAHNRAQLLSQTIESVLAQDFRDYELIVVDDGSTDETRRLVSSYKDSRLTYLYQDNMGAPAARNYGWRESHTDYVLFLDSDDRLFPDALQLLLAEALAHPGIGVIGGDYQYIDEHGHVIGEANLWKHGDQLDLSHWVLACSFIPSATLIKGDWLSQVDGFDEGQLAAQDWDLWLRLAAAGCPMRWCFHLVCQYRLHRGGLSRNYERHRLASFRALNKVYASTNLPADVEKLRAEVFGNIDIISAARKYSAGQISGAQQDLGKAAQLLPEWVNSGQLLERLLRAGQNIYFAAKYEDYAKIVLSNLPEFLNRNVLIRRALGRVAAADLFTDYRNEEWSRLGELWWRTVLSDPHWLANLGILSIGMQTLLGKKLTRAVRRVI